MPVDFENGSGGDLPLATIMMVTLLLYLVVGGWVVGGARVKTKEGQTTLPINKMDKIIPDKKSQIETIETKVDQLIIIRQLV